MISRAITTRRVGRLMLAALLWLAVWPTAAHAYIDPGAGSLLVQALLSMVFGSSVLFRRKIRGLVVRLFGRAKDSPPEVRKDSPDE